MVALNIECSTTLFAKLSIFILAMMVSACATNPSTDSASEITETEDIWSPLESDEKYVHLFTNETACSMQEVGIWRIKNPVVFSGTRWSKGDLSGCKVVIQQAVFEKSYSYCFLTGFSFHKPGRCMFAQREKKGNKYYVFEFNDKDTVNCKFTCIKH